MKHTTPSDLTHRWEALRPIWWIAPLSSLLLLLLYPVWKDVAGLPLLLSIAINLCAGTFACFRSLTYVRHVSFGSAVLLITVLISLTAGPVAALAALLFRFPPHIALGFALGTVGLMLLLAIAGTVRATRTDWTASQHWLRENADMRRFRVFQRIATTNAKPPNQRLVFLWLAIAFAAINTVGYLIFGDPQKLRLILVPALAFAMVVIFGKLSFQAGKTVAAIIHLRRIEKSTGHRFILGNIEELHRERRAHWLGRWITPKELKLDPVHGSQR